MVALGLVAIATRRWTVEQRLRSWARMSPPGSAPSRRFIEIDTTFGAWLILAIGVFCIVIGILTL